MLPPCWKGVASLCEAKGLSDSLCELVNIVSVNSATSVLRKGEGNQQHGVFQPHSTKKVRRVSLRGEPGKDLINTPMNSNREAYRLYC